MVLISTRSRNTDRMSKHMVPKSYYLSCHFLRLDLSSGSCVTRMLILFIAGINAFTARFNLLIFDDYSFLCLMLMDGSLAFLP